MPTDQQLQDLLDDVSVKLGLNAQHFNVDGDGLATGNRKITVESWSHDYSVDPAKLAANLDPKTLILNAIRLSAP